MNLAFLILKEVAEISLAVESKSLLAKSDPSEVALTTEIAPKPVLAVGAAPPIVTVIT